VARPKTGLQPFQPRRPRLDLRGFLDTGYAPPAVADRASLVPSWPMYANDRYGDCVWASIGHSVQSMTYYGGRRYTVLPERGLLSAYTDVTGFERGRPATDQGTVLADALNHWRKKGVAGDRILAFAFVDKRFATYAAGIDLFGFLNVGIDLPGFAWSRFERGRTHWGLPTPTESLADEGRHAIHVAGYDANAREFLAVTWGRLITVDWAFLHRYAREAWVVLSNDWLDAWGRSPRGLEMRALGDQFAELTGEPSPLPEPHYRARACDRELWAQAGAWAGGHHRGEAAGTARALESWARANGLEDQARSASMQTGPRGGTTGVSR
jgi:hypothetical protein